MISKSFIAKLCLLLLLFSFLLPKKWKRLEECYAKVINKLFIISLLLKQNFWLEKTLLQKCVEVVDWSYQKGLGVQRTNRTCTQNWSYIYTTNNHKWEIISNNMLHSFFQVKDFNSIWEDGKMVYLKSHNFVIANFGFLKRVSCTYTSF